MPQTAERGTCDGTTESATQGSSSLRTRVEAHDDLLGAVLVGSMVAEKNGAFGDVWANRCVLHEPNVTACWDQRESDPAHSGAHRSIDSNLVLVECLITAPNSGVRLAHHVELWQVTTVSHLERRPPVDRREMRGTGADPTLDVDIETAYDILKDAVRRHRR